MKTQEERNWREVFKAIGYANLNEGNIEALLTQNTADTLERVKENICKYQIMIGEHKYHCECKAGNDYLDKFLQVLREDKEALTPDKSDKQEVK